MKMKEQENRIIRLLFYECGGNFYEVIDDDGIRKPAVRTYLADVEKPTKEHGFDKEIWKVEISWRLLARYFAEDENAGDEK